MSEYYTAVQPKWLLRRAFSLFLEGEGIEIGALHQPLDIQELAITKIRYVDRIPLEALRKHYPELAKYKFTPVDVLDDGEKLSSFKHGSLDFIIANHFIEHTSNPIGTVRNWLQRLRSGGVIFIAAPDMRFIFDADRPLTSVEHLAEDDKLSAEQREQVDREHYLEYARLVNKQQGEEISRHAEFLKNIRYSIHFHTFVPSSFLQMLRYSMEQLHLPFNIRAFAAAPKGSDEFLAVLSKI